MKFTFNLRKFEITWLPQWLEPLSRAGWFDTVLYRVESGKEAMVYCCEARQPQPFKALRSIPLKPVIFLPKSSTKLRSSSHWIAFTATYRTTTSWCGTKISPSSTFAKPSMPKHIPPAFHLLHRDVDRVYQYFRRFGIEADVRKFARAIWHRYVNEALQPQSNSSIVL
jgi:serine/threonine-protein kinase RIO1